MRKSYRGRSAAFIDIWGIRGRGRSGDSRRSRHSRALGGVRSDSGFEGIRRQRTFEAEGVGHSGRKAHRRIWLWTLSGSCTQACESRQIHRLVTQQPLYPYARPSNSKATLWGQRARGYFWSHWDVHIFYCCGWDCVAFAFLLVGHMVVAWEYNRK